MGIMRVIRILQGPVTLPARVVLRLTERQAGRRRHMLEKQGDGDYLANDRTQWKTGETLSTDAEIPKNWAELVEVVVAPVKELDVEPANELIIEPAIETVTPKKRRAKSRLK